MAGLQCAGQSATGAADAGAQPAPGVKVHTLDPKPEAQKPLHPKPQSTLFPLNDTNPARESLEFRTPDQMTATDRQLAENNQGEIARRAAFQGMRVEESGADGWGYEQAVCPVFPQQLILEYSRVDATGSVTLFSAVIPRGSEGHVRVIPIRRRSYSLWTPSSSNAITLNDFNHMVSEGGSGLAPDWLTMGLCYAALAGGHVRAALVTQEVVPFPMYPPARLVLSRDGTAQVQFADVTPGVRAMEWTMMFTQKGRLQKVKHDKVDGIAVKQVAGTAVGPEVISAAAPAK